jgi:hypothetical protein
MHANIFSIPTVLMTSEAYNDLHRDLQAFCFPFDIFQKQIFYKIYSFYDIQSNKEDNSTDLYLEEFNVQRLIAMRNQINVALSINFEILIELLYSSLQIAYQVNQTTKSLANLAFHNLINNNYQKVDQILIDLLKELIKEDTFDSVFYLKMKLLKDHSARKLQTL